MTINISTTLISMDLMQKLTLLVIIFVFSFTLTVADRIFIGVFLHGLYPCIKIETHFFSRDLCYTLTKYCY